VTIPPIARRTSIALLLGIIACGENPVAPVEVVDVYTPGEAFSPFTAYVLVGGTVRFNITGDDHDVTFSKNVSGAPEDVLVVRDTVVSRTFPVKGTFPYTCKVHPGMNGEVVVQ
jgi:plastocyanin